MRAPPVFYPQARTDMLVCRHTSMSVKNTIIMAPSPRFLPPACPALNGVAHVGYFPRFSTPIHPPHTAPSFHCLALTLGPCQPWRLFTTIDLMPSIEALELFFLPPRPRVLPSSSPITKCAKMHQNAPPEKFSRLETSNIVTVPVGQNRTKWDSFNFVPWVPFRFGPGSIRSGPAPRAGQPPRFDKDFPALVASLTVNGT